MEKSLLIILLSVFSLSLFPSKGFAQNANKFTWSKTNVSFKEVFDEVKKQTGYTVFYNNSVINDQEKIKSINFASSDLTAVLSTIFKGHPVEWNFNDKLIILKKNTEKITPDSDQSAKKTRIAGMVTSSDDHLSLPGVSIKLKGSSGGTVSDVNGSFNILADIGQPLVFSYIGYQSQEVVITSDKDLNIVLVKGNSALNEVVVVGYGTQKKAMITGAVSSIAAKDLENQIGKNILDDMAAQLPGVAVQSGTGRPGSNPVVRIRGTGSISASNTPLYVIDGVPMENSDDINAMNPNDIESVDVLKDAASAAIYGSRGGNGVVIITTKKGKAGQAKIDFSFSTGIQTVSKKIDVLDRDQHIEFEKAGQAANWASVGGDINIPNGQRTKNGQNYNYPQSFDNPGALPNTNWQNEIFRKAPLNNYQLSAQGGSANTTYYISGNYFTQDGIIKATDFKRYAAKINISSKISKLVQAGVNLTPSYTIENIRQTDGHPTSGDGGIILKALTLPPTVTPRYDGGLYGGVLGNPEYVSTGYSQISSPLQVLEDPDYKNKRESARVTGDIFAELKPIPEITIRTSFGGDFRNYWQNYYRPSTISIGSVAAMTPESPNGNINNIASSHNENRSMRFAWSNTATYKKVFNKVHDLTLLAGFSAEKNNAEASVLTGQSGTFDNDLVNYVSGASIITSTANKEQWSLLSYLGRVNYAYKGKYLLTTSIRRDGSSRFAPNNKWAVFPSLSVGWIASEEDFLKKQSFISNLKFRASYGVTGNFNIGNYRWQALLAKYNYSFGTGDGTLATGYAPSGFSNPDLTWEENRQTDVGLDVGILNERFTLAIDYYNRVTDNLLYSIPVPSITGFTSTFGNVGKIRNSGFEIEVNSKNIKTNNFLWSTNLNLSKNTNKVLQLGKNNEPIIVTSENTVTQITQVGGALGAFFGYPIAGIFKDQAEVNAHPEMKFNASSGPGDTKFIDTDGDGKITSNDRTILGSNAPDFIYGINNHFSYKKLSLDIQLQGVQGGKVFFLSERFIGTNGLSLNQLTESALNRWVSPDQPGSGTYTKITPANALSPGLTESSVSRWLYDASYLRIRNITLSYGLPLGLVKRAHFTSARLSLGIQNLYTFSKYIGYNPETNLNGESVTAPGIDYGVYPLPRTFTLGINLSL
jgi:TonB-linked SusC/RagA family outer membrane protein